MKPVLVIDLTIPSWLPTMPPCVARQVTGALIKGMNVALRPPFQGRWTIEGRP